MAVSQRASASRRSAHSSPAAQDRVVKQLPHRGAHDIGLVLGHTGEEVYVPRATWTTTIGSPLNNRSIEYDPKQHANDVLKLAEKEDSMRKFYKNQLTKQMQQNEAHRQSMRDEQRSFANATFSDAQRTVMMTSVERDAVEESKRVVKAGLDEQRAEAQRRAQENQAREMHEAAEMKLRTVQALCEEMDKMRQRKENAAKDADDIRRHIEAKRQAQQNEKKRDAEEMRRYTQANAMRAEHQQAAQQQRLRGALEKQEQSFKRFTDTTVQAEAARRAEDESKLERSVADHQALTDLHYSRREGARERQRLRMIETLKGQVEAQKQGRGLLDLQKQAELHAVNASTQRSFEQEISKFHRKRQEELQLQKDLVEMMAKKQQQAKSDGGKVPLAMQTMQVSPAMLADARTRASPGMAKSASAPDLNQCMGAARYLAKPCGRPEERPPPPSGTSPAGGRHGSAAQLGRADGAASSHKSPGGGHVLSKSAHIAARDKQISQPWHQGLTAADMKVARQAAARRGAAAAADKAET